MDFDEAVRCSAERADPVGGPSFICYLAMDYFDRALASFDGAIAAEPSNAIGYLARSNFYARRAIPTSSSAIISRRSSFNPNAEKLWMEVDGWFDNKQAKVDAELNRASILIISVCSCRLNGVSDPERLVAIRQDLLPIVQEANSLTSKATTRMRSRHGTKLWR